MKQEKNFSQGRRNFLKASAVVAAGVSLVPSFTRCTRKPKLMTRPFGRIDHEVTTFGLGGQASIQWTPEDVDPVAIILKSFDAGVNYFDTSNLYGPSQTNYGKAFRQLGLIPGGPGYDQVLRRSVFLTSKTHLRFARGGWEAEGMYNWTNGTDGHYAIDDLKRSLSQIFGDGKGNYPKGAYLDMVLIHDVSSMADVDAVYEGLYDTDPKTETIGALAALRDYRDGTNLTGLNPDEDKLIRHIGFSGHYNSAVMMNMIQRDRENLLDGLLVAVNSNDKLNFNMQHNVIPVAQARNMGLIGMKVFADGAMYAKPARWSGQPGDVVRQVGSDELAFKPLIQYTLTTPGISTAIIGIGEISDDPARCQLTQNIIASQIAQQGLSEGDREEVEELTRHVKAGKTNYFQQEKRGLTSPQDVVLEKQAEGVCELRWQTAYADATPLARYEILRNGETIGAVDHWPQTSMEGFSFSAEVISGQRNEYQIITVDKAGNRAESEMLAIG